MAAGRQRVSWHRHSGRRRHGNTYLQPRLVGVARTTIRHHGHLESLYYRHVTHNHGHHNKTAGYKGIITVAHAILVIMWHVLVTSTPYDDLGADCVDCRTDPDRETRSLIACLEALGRRVTGKDAT